MPDFSQLGSHFKQRFTTDTGKHVLGRLLPVPENAGRGASIFFIPRRLLVVKPNSGVTSGMILTDSAGRRLLTSWSGDDSAPGGEYQEIYKLYDLDTRLNWSRNTLVKDPVTGLNTSNVLEPLGTIWATLELLGPDINSLTAISRYRVLSNQVFQLNDHLAKTDGSKTYTVRRSETALGITIAEVA